MKIVFLFDQTDAEGKVVATESIPFVTTPDKLNLRQLAPGLSSVGVVFEQNNEKGEKQLIFRQIINFPVNLLDAQPTLEAEIAALKKLLAEKIGQQVLEAEAAKAEAAKTAELASVVPQAVPAAAGTNGAEKTEKSVVVKKVKKSGK